MKKTVLLLFFMILLLSLGVVWGKNVVGVRTISQASSTSTKIYVDPIGIINQGLNVGDTFLVNINISNVVDLGGFEFKLYWDPNILTYDHDNEVVGNIWPEYLLWKREHNDTEGYYYLSYTKKNTVNSFTGSGYLAQIYLKVNNVGISALDLRGTKPGNSNALPIIHEVRDGIFSSYPCNSDRTLPDGKCYEVCGASPECDERSPGESWCDGNTKKSCSSTCQYSETPRIQGDFNCDGVVDGLDFYILLQAWGTTPPSDPRADANNDGAVDGSDFYILLQNWGKFYEG